MSRQRIISKLSPLSLAALLLSATIAPCADTAPVQNAPEIWKDPSTPVSTRVDDLLHRLTLEEKVSQLLANPPAIPRLGIPAYSHRNECLHGIVSGNGTVFPQAIGMAATWDTQLVHDEADAISTEARAQHNEYVKTHGGDSGEQNGLNFYSPNINIFRDPRWGRGQETYGEDPFLTSQFGVAFITGLQGNDPKHLKVVACAKHFAVHSGPERERHRFNATPSERDLYDTYLPAFESAVRVGHVGSVMGAYSSLNGTPDCADPFLLTDLLRNRWGFDGLVFSDGGAIGDVWVAHQFVPTPEEAAAAAVKAGCDVSSGGMGQIQHNAATQLAKIGPANNGLKAGRAFSYLTEAQQKGLISEGQIDASVRRELTMRFRLGMFDPPSMVQWSSLGREQIDTPEHRSLALKVAQESIVLLKNQDHVLPLDRQKLRQILVVGPNADSATMLVGNYTGKPSRSVTILEGIKELAGPRVTVSYIEGCPLARKIDHSNDPPAELATHVFDEARHSDLVIFVGGLSAALEKEEGRDPFEGFDDGDRTRIELPPMQEDLIKAIYATGKPVIFVNCSGSAIAMPWEAAHLPGILQAWYPGEEGGRAVAQVLFGVVNPAGRLPVTFYRSTDDLPAFTDYSMNNRTYRYFQGKPLYAFGHGLSYTTFKYNEFSTDALQYKSTDSIRLTITISNTGDSDGDEIVQVYAASEAGKAAQTLQSLCGFERVHVARGQQTRSVLTIPVDRLRHWDERTQAYVINPGEYILSIGSAFDDIRGTATVAVVPEFRSSK